MTCGHSPRLQPKSEADVPKKRTHIQETCEVIVKKTSQDASDAIYGVVFFGPHCVWLGKYSFNEVLIQ